MANSNYAGCTNYQGTTLRRPFFFLLVDSFWLPEGVAFWVELCEPSAFVPSVASAFEPSPADFVSPVPVVVVVFTGLRICVGGCWRSCRCRGRLGVPRSAGIRRVPVRGCGCCRRLFRAVSVPVSGAATAGRAAWRNDLNDRSVTRPQASIRRAATYSPVSKYQSRKYYPPLAASSAHPFAPPQEAPCVDPIAPATAAS